MKLPDLKYATGIRKNTQVKFGGLNMTEGASDGELIYTVNMGLDHSPVLSTRKERRIVNGISATGGLHGHDGLAWVDGTSFYYRGIAVGEVTTGAKRLCSMGPYIVIFPDKAYFNVESREFGALEASWSGENVSFGDGLYKEEPAAANALTCQGADFGSIFREGDAVTISGCSIHEENNKTAVIRAIDGDTLYFSENCFTLDGEAGDEAYGEVAVSVERRVPDLEHICHNENRLWGCDGTTIYASAWGDIFNWNTFDGTDADSWALEPSSAGEFTGCFSFKGYPVFFKEDVIYKIYGSAPSGFSCMETGAPGVKLGCAGSLAVADGVLFYVSRRGPMAYSGGVPVWIGGALGDYVCGDAVGGSDGVKYYMAARGGEYGTGDMELYVYDTRCGEWIREDFTDVYGFAWDNGTLYAAAADGLLIAGGAMVNPRKDTFYEGNLTWVQYASDPEGVFPWEAVFADFTGKEPDTKTVHKIQVRLRVEDAGGYAQVWIRSDGGDYVSAGGKILSDVKDSYVLPIVPRRCDHFQVKITGEGQCKIWSVSLHVRKGSESRLRIEPVSGVPVG